MSWIGDPRYKFDKGYKQGIKEGLYPEPSLDEIAEEYIRHLNVDSYSVLHNDNGEMIAIQQSKLGNEKYARSFFARTAPVMKAFDDFVFDQPVGSGGGRYDVRLGHAFLITLTYDHKLYSPIEAYARVSKDINLFKAHLEKIFGPYVSQVVKESDSSGYPAPHMIFISVKPHLIYKKEEKWRVKDFSLYRRLHTLWFDISGSSISDVEAIVDNRVNSHNPKTGEACRSSAIRYVFKYITKSLSAADLMDPESGKIRIPEDDATRVYTLAMTKYTGTRTILSKAFCTFLGVSKGELDPRLVELCNELKRLKRRKSYLQMIATKYDAALGWVLMPEFTEYMQIDSKIEEVKQR